MSRRLRPRRAYGDDGTSRGRHPSARDLEPLLVHRGEELRSGDEQIDLCVSHRCSRDTDPLHPFRQLDLTGVDRIGGLVDQGLVLGESLAQLEALDLLVLDAVELLWLGRQGAGPASLIVWSTSPPDGGTPRRRCSPPRRTEGRSG